MMPFTPGPTCMSGVKGIIAEYTGSTFVLLSSCCLVGVLLWCESPICPPTHTHTHTLFVAAYKKANAAVSYLFVTFYGQMPMENKQSE